MTQCLGIYREIAHSPDREFDDYEILRQTARRLEEAGLSAPIHKPEEVFEARGEWRSRLPELAFVMCEKEHMIRMLQEWESLGVTVVNSMQGVLNTYRYRMVPLLQKAGVPMPKSELVSTEKFETKLFSSEELRSVWVKRGDVHNTQKGDVALARSEEEVRAALESFRSRRLCQAVLQAHVPGDLIKFYGVNGEWFQWFYHKNQDLKKYPFSYASLQDVTRRTAGALGLEVYGGDAIVSPDGNISVIDINAWPSFALFREEASKAIARHLQSKLRKTAGR